MTVDASASTLTPKSGCDTTGLALGSSAAFNEETSVNSVTLVTGGATSSLNCYWDLTDVSISQTIPKEQKAEAYSINMTLTIVAN